MIRYLHKKGLLCALLIVISLLVKAQMPVRGDTLYGFEWIDYDKAYFKFRCPPGKGLARIRYEQLVALGADPAAIVGSKLDLFHLGEVQPIWVSSQSTWTTGDYLLFIKPERTDFLDRFCYVNPDSSMLNPGYGLVSDSMTYFLSLEGQHISRYNEIPFLSSSAVQPEEWFFDTVQVYQGTQFYKRPNGLSSLSRFMTGDGFAGPLVNQQELVLESPQFYPGAAPPRLLYRMISNNSQNHDLEILFNGQKVADYQFNNYRYIRDSLQLTGIALSNSNRFVFRRNGPQENRYALAQLSLIYPRAFNWQFSGAIGFKLHGAGEKHLQLSNYDGTPLILCQPEQKNIWFYQKDTNLLALHLDQTVNESYYLLQKADQVSDAVPIGFRKFEKLSEEDVEMIIVFHPGLRTDNNGTDWVDAYRQYREQSGISTEICNVLELYDQFGYGNDHHFLAIRNYLAYLRKTKPSLRYVLLMGKGLDISHIRSSSQWQQNSNQFFIPTYGVPGSDILFTCSNHQLDQAFSIGRIPAVMPSEIGDYLSKLIAFEQGLQTPRSEAARLWQKRIIHIHGGRNAAEQNQLREILGRMRNDIETNSFAADVQSFGKQSNEPIQGSAPEQIYRLINEGTGIFTFLGHSGSTTLDFDIDNLSLYNNQHRYPFFIALGCSVGNIFSPTKSLGERFNLTRDKGTIVFFSTSGLGYPATLESYARQLYSKFDRWFDNLSIGQIIQEVNLANSGTPNRLLQETIEQHILNGDPALKPAYNTHPDYVTDRNSLQLDPVNPVIQTTSITLKFDVLNAGRKDSVAFAIRILLQAPDGTSDTLTVAGFKATRFRNAVSISMPLPRDPISGVYNLSITLNYNDLAAEGPLPEAKQNNTLSDFSFFVGDANARPVFPPEFSVLGEDSVRLITLLKGAVSPEERLRLEWDTVPDFSMANSLLIPIEYGKLAYENLIEIPSGFRDSITIFWRVKIEHPDTSTTNDWRTSSFTRIRGSNWGIGMFHPDQFRRLGDQSLFIDTFNLWRHRSVDRQYLIRNAIFRNSAYPSGFYDGQRINSFFPFVSLLEGLVVLVIDPITGKRWSNPPGGRYGSRNALNEPIESFPFATKETESRTALVHFLKDTIPDGAVVVMYSILRTSNADYGIQHWASDSSSIGINLFQLMEREGFSELRGLENQSSVPFILSYRKGVEALDFVAALSPMDTIISTIVIPEALQSGNLQWKSKILRDIADFSYSAEPPAVYSTAIIRWDLKDGNERFLQSTDLEGQQNLQKNINDSLTIEIYSENDKAHAYRPKHYLLRGAFHPDLLWTSGSLQADSLQEGSPLTLTASLKNNSNSIADTAEVAIHIMGSSGSLFADTLRFGKLMAFEEKAFQWNPSGLILPPGNFQLNAKLIYPAAELREDNNELSIRFHVIADNSRPVLEVFFDGRRINDGELVSSKPEIQLRLRDQNPWLRITDSTSIMVKLRNPGASEFIEIAANHPSLRFVPAEETGNNEAVLYFTPDLHLDGEYMLEVQGRDASGNQSGREPLRIRFKVLLEQAISSLSNYPNPFSSRTQFVYTLSGSESPTTYAIRIYTLSGHLVREISHLELGPLKIGQQITEYAWDGRDQYGNLLANGVYLYRLEIRDNQHKALKHLDTRLDRFSENGWSKMLILR